MKNTSRLLIFFLLILSFNAKTQQLALPDKSGDCSFAIDITGKTSVHSTAPKGWGQIQEIESEKGDLYYFEKEHFTVWYSFIAAEDAIFTLDIIPDLLEDDYDFILFECPEINCCEAIANKSLKPVRTNISRSKIDQQGKTGLSKDASQEFVHEGKGNNYSASLRIKKNRKYILLLDNVYGGNGGHEINLFFEPIKVKNEKTINTSAMLSLTVVDGANQSMIDANLVLIHFDADYKPDTILRQTNSSVFLPLQRGSYYEVLIHKDEYLGEKISFKVSEEDTLISQQIELQNVSVGSKFELKNVYFIGGTAKFEANSQNALRKLYYILKNNPTIDVEIEGHVNLPYGTYKKKSEEYYNQLSIDRAKAVYDYLVQRGISSARLNYQGYGYAQMIFPEANTSEQMQKNRRVEVKIVGN